MEIECRFGVAIKACETPKVFAAWCDGPVSGQLAADRLRWAAQKCMQGRVKTNLCEGVHEARR